MANTIGYGQAAVNNTIGYGQGAKEGSSFSNLKSIELDGVDDYVSINNNSTIARTQNISYSIWVNLVDGTARQYFVGNWSSSNKGTGLSIESSNTLVFQLGDGTNDSYFNSRVANFTTYAANNTWNHILATWDGTDAKIYINGTIRNTWTPSSLTISNWSVFWIGRRNANTSNLTYGKLDEVAVFNSGLSASDVTAIYNSGAPTSLSSYSSLVSWWRCGDSDTAPTLTDNKGSNDGTMTNFSTFSTDVPT